MHMDVSPQKIAWPRVWLAPMSGSSDAAMRAAATYWGAPAVVSEMVASEALVANRGDMVDRTVRHDGAGLWIVQLAARRPEDMAAAAAKLAGLGVDVIDINMGCPARQVVGGASGSALMREPCLAQEIMHAAVEAAMPKPVTLKMRLGWDDASLNAPIFAEMATDAGIQMLTVHGRTRCQFYKGQANWKRIADTVAATHLPVIANGDIDGPDSARAALQQSGAYGVMIGRAAMGRPWLVAQIAASLDGDEFTVPSLTAQVAQLVAQIEDSVALYGGYLGVKIVRKHVAAWLNTLPNATDVNKGHRAIACRIESATALIEYLRPLSKLRRVS